MMNPPGYPVQTAARNCEQEATANKTSLSDSYEVLE
jgi:hypothetical protein